VKFAIAWPEATPGRVIPRASKSIAVRVKVAEFPDFLEKRTLNRPTTGALVSEFAVQIPTGTVTVTADAFPEADGVGVKQAFASKTYNNVTSDLLVSMTMDSTVDRLELSQLMVLARRNETIKLRGDIADLGRTTLDCTAYNKNNQIVLVDPRAFALTVGDPAVATVSEDRLSFVTQGDGDTTLTVTDTESTTFAQATLRVSNNIHTIKLNVPGTANNVWVAFRDGDNPWYVVPPSSWGNNGYTSYAARISNAAGVYSYAVAIKDRNQVSAPARVMIFNSTVAETTNDTVVCPGRPNIFASGRRASVTVLGGEGQLRIGNKGYPTVKDSDGTVSASVGVPTGLFDLSAVVVSALAPQPSKMLLQRELMAVPDSIDFNSTDAFAPVPVTITSDAATKTLRVVLRTAGGTVAYNYVNKFAANTASAVALPDGKSNANDLYSLILSDGKRNFCITTAWLTAATYTGMLPAPIENPTVEPDGLPDGNSTPSFGWTPYTEPDTQLYTLYLANGQPANDWMFFVSEGWAKATSTTGSYKCTAPLLTQQLPGWNAEWKLDGSQWMPVRFSAYTAQNTTLNALMNFGAGLLTQDYNFDRGMSVRYATPLSTNANLGE